MLALPGAPAAINRRDSPLRRDDHAFRDTVQCTYSLASAEDTLLSIKPNIFETPDLDSFPKIILEIMPKVQQSGPIVRWAKTNDCSPMVGLANAATLRMRLTSSFVGDYTPLMGVFFGAFVYFLFFVCLVFASIKFDFSFLTCARVAVVVFFVVFCVAGRSRLRGCHADDILEYYPLAIAFFLIASRKARTSSGIADLRQSAIYGISSYHNEFASVIADPVTMAAAHGMTLDQVRDVANKFATEVQGYQAIDKGDQLFQQMQAQPPDVKASMMKYAVAMKYVDTPAARRYCERCKSWAFRFSYN